MSFRPTDGYNCNLFVDTADVGYDLTNGEHADRTAAVSNRIQLLVAECQTQVPVALSIPGNETKIPSDAEERSTQRSADQAIETKREERGEKIERA